MPQQSHIGSQQQHQSGQTTGQQHTQHQSHGTGQRFKEVETPQQHQAMQGILEAVETCEWCADQCIQHADPNMVECIRLCEDVAELGETAMTLVPRRSRYAQRHLQTFVDAAQACARECSQHSHGHCQECSQVLQQATNDVQQFLSSFQQQGGQGTSIRTGGAQ